MFVDLSTCPIPGATGIGVPEGTGANRVLILGEALGDSEVRDGGLPFRPFGQAGSVLERAIRRAGFNREQFVIFNVVPTHPPKNWLEGAPYEAEAIAWGRQYLDRVIEQYKPQAIVTLGSTATRAVTGLAGRHMGMNYLSGYAVPSFYDIPTLPYYHPSYLRRGAMALFGGLVRVLRMATAMAKAGVRAEIATPLAPPLNYMMHPTEGTVQDYLRFIEKNPDLFIGYDIETAHSNETTEDEAEEYGDTDIRSVQISLGMGSGIFIPYRAPFKEAIRPMLASPNPKLGWNIWKFDNPLLRHNGVRVEGPSHDLMWAWHHLQPDLPRGLQFAAGQLGWPFPWKHLDHENPEYYGIIDVDVLHFMKDKIFKAMRERGIWRGYDRYVFQLNPVLEDMSKRGIPVDPTEYAKVKAQLEAESREQLINLNAKIPLEIKPFTPPKGYKKVPKDTTGLIMHTFEDGERWIKPGVWKPSNKGLIRYMKAKGHPVPRNYKTDKENTQEYEIKRMVKLDPFYKDVIDYRETNVILKNHVKNWVPAADGRVHSEFYFDPATGQLSSRRPNVQNAPKHKGHADLFRGMIQAPEGYTLLEADFHSFHAQTLAFEAQDADYLRLAKLDIHSYLTAHLIHDPKASVCLSWADDELREYLGWIKKNNKFMRDYKAKRAILGYGFGMQWRKLYDMNKESFANQAEAKRTIGMLDVLFPKTKAWRDTIRAQAHEQGYLISRSGCIRYFWEVYKWQGGKWSPGLDGEAAIAFLPANDAFGEMKDKMLTMAEQGYLERYNLINQIHDALKFLVPDSLLDEAIEVVPNLMEEASTTLVNPLVPNGLKVEVSVMVGKKWNDMKELKR